MSRIRSIASFVRWRLVPVRYLTMLRGLHWNYFFKSGPVKTSVCREIERVGYQVTTPIEKDLMERAISIYGPRIQSVVPKGYGHPFVNLFTEEDLHPENPVFNLAFSTKVLDIAADYFGNKLILDSIQVLHSYSTDGDIRESQYWHLDYGDRKSFHAIIYLNDVKDDQDGPFVFVNKLVTKKIGRSLIVRRIKDAEFFKEMGSREVKKFLGPAGSMVYVDPSACYHYGSRCTESRLAIFVTYSSWLPFAQPVKLVTNNRQKIYSAAKQMRPDLNVEMLQTLLQLE